MNGPPQRIARRIWLIWAGPALVAAGFIITRMWDSLPRAHAAELMGIAALALGMGAVARRLRPIPWADALVFVFALLLTCFAGPLPVASATLLALVALGLGRAMQRERADAASAITLGLAVAAAVIGWLLPFPLHFRFVYLALSVLLLLLLRGYVRAAFSDSVAAWRRAVDADRRAAAAAVLCVGLASVGCWIPTVQFDDLGYHLGLPAQLVALGHYRMDAHSQIWALAPWSGDIVQAIVQMLSGAEARGAVDALWLVLVASFAWQLAAAFALSPRGRGVCVGLVASQPLLAALVGGMQAELPATAASLAIALLVVRCDAQARAPAVAAFAIFAGLLLGLKTGFVAIVLPLAAVLLWRWRASLSLRGVLASVLLMCLIGGSSYVYAAALTGNPVFPILNALFRSPLMDPVNLHDPRWSAPVAWDLPWRLTFYSREYGEGWNGLAGFTSLALLGALPFALAQPRVRMLAWCALLAFLAAILSVHYFRYTFPALMVLLPCLVAAVFASLSERAATGLLGGVIALNFAYQGTSYWTLHSGAITREVGTLGTEPVLRRFAPERVLLAMARSRQPDANVLLCEQGAPFAAELAGRGFVASHYDPELERARRVADADGSGAAWRALFARTQAHFVVAGPDASEALRAALSNARAIERVGSVELWELPVATPSAPDFAAQRDESQRVLPWR